jgi:hypothetical protein
VNRYAEDGPFNDPIVICDSCNEIQKTVLVKYSGRCMNCGNRKFRNVQVINENQMPKVMAMNLDPEFLALFEEVKHG